MTPEEIQQIKDTVSKQIETSVNGGIREMKASFAKHVADDAVTAEKLFVTSQELSNHIKDFKEFRETAEPALQTISQWKGWGNVNARIGAFLLGVATVGGLLWEIFKKR